MRERIREIIEREGMGQSQFADYIGVNRPTLSHILAGRNNPSMEVVMKIHQKFPKINILWLLDGVGSYEGDAMVNDPSTTLTEEYAPREASPDTQSAYTLDVQSASSSPASAGVQLQSRFRQGELFAEDGVAQRVQLGSTGQASHLDAVRQNAVFASESTSAAKNRKEMPLHTPPKAPYLSESQIEYARKSLQRKIVEIKIFFDDGTYETFRNHHSLSNSSDSCSHVL